MRDFEVLSKSTHANVYWKKHESYLHSQSETVIPVLISEISSVVPHYMTGFVKSNTGDVVYVCMVGLESYKNLYITDKGQWLCPYVPATIRAYPFMIAKDQDDRGIVCIAKDAISNSNSKGKLLFNTEGELGPETEAYIKFVTACENDKARTRVAVDLIKELDLIELANVQLNVADVTELNDVSNIKVDGLYRISEQKFSDLDADQLVRLRDAGALNIIFGSIFSLSRSGQLVDRLRFKLKEKISSDRPYEDLDSILSKNDEDILNFDKF